MKKQTCKIRLIRYSLGKLLDNKKKKDNLRLLAIQLNKSINKMKKKTILGKSNRTKNNIYNNFPKINPKKWKK